MALNTKYWESEAQKTFRVVEAMARATKVLGSTEEAASWLHRPAWGLNRQKPIDLVLSPEGLEAVLTYLGRIEYGVYC